LDEQHERVTEHNPAASNEDDDELSHLYNLANLILEECKNTSPPSAADATIRLFQDALDQRLASHPLQSDSLKDLTGTRVMRSSLTQQLQDHLDQSLVLRGNVVSESRDVSMGTEGRNQGDVRGSSVFIVKFELKILIEILTPSATS
jgi:hypothetical protein